MVAYGIGHVDMFVYKEDILLRSYPSVLSLMNIRIETTIILNFSTNSNTRNYVNKVLRTDYNGLGYNVIFTS